MRIQLHILQNFEYQIDVKLSSSFLFLQSSYITSQQIPSRRQIRRENMVGISSNISLSTVSTYPLEKEGLLLMRKKSTCNFMVVSKNRFKMGRTGIHCKLPAHSHGSGVEDNPRGKNLSLSSTNKMEEYNTSMKRMMRNPCEYHHDLGQLVSLFLIISCS